MTLIGVLVLVILVVLLTWIIAQMGLQEPFRTILMVVILLIVLVAALSITGLLPYGTVTIR